ncbi:MAG TPA: SHOCT domain-containing protein [Gaiellales bacterium]|nr:SHOCT domain-containing protein [Gaiellales bacterium]
MTTDATAAAPRSSHRIAVPLLIALGVLCIAVSTISAWLQDSALDSGTWADESGQLLRSQNVRQLVASYAVDQAVASSDAQARIAAGLPPALKPLAGPATAALSNAAVQATDRALQLPQLQSAWVSANRQAHGKLVDFLEGNTDRLSSTNGNVQLNLNVLVAEVAQRLGASPDAVARAQSVPAVTVIRADQLSTVQQGIQVLHVLSVWPLFIGVALLGLATYLAHGRRRQAIRSASIGLLLVGVALLVIQRMAGELVVNDLVKVDGVRPAAQDAWNIYTQLLVESAWAGVAIGLLGFVGTLLAGPAPYAVRLRHRLAPTMREHPLWPHAVLALVAMIVLLIGPTGTPRRGIGIVLMVVLAFAGLEVWRRQAVAELEPLPVAEGAAPETTAVAPAAPDALAQLTALHADGTITDAEFEAARHRLQES